MPNFLETILAQLKRADGRVVLREIRGDHFVSVTGGELLDQIQLARLYLQSAGLQPGDRCALLAPNSIRWAALYLALMAEGRSNVGIAHRLWVTESTVEKQVHHILTKLRLSETDDDHRRVLAALTYLQAC